MKIFLLFLSIFIQLSPMWALEKNEELKNLDDEIISDLDFFQNYQMIKNQDTNIDTIDAIEALNTTLNDAPNKEISHEN